MHINGLASCRATTFNWTLFASAARRRAIRPLISASAAAALPSWDHDRVGKIWVAESVGKKTTRLRKNLLGQSSCLWMRLSGQQTSLILISLSQCEGVWEFGRVWESKQLTKNQRGQSESQDESICSANKFNPDLTQTEV